MKKLTRKSLDELARVMPVISEAKQRIYFGGTFYYNNSGQLLGEIPDGNYAIKIGNSTGDSGAIDFSASNQDTKNNVLTTMANSIGISGSIGFFENPENPNHMGGIDASGNIYVNSNAKIYLSGNYYDFLSVLHHEHYHQMTLSGYAFSSGQNEYQALIYEINQSGFQYTSDYYKSGTYNAYDQFHIE